MTGGAARRAPERFDTALRGLWRDGTRATLQRYLAG